MFIALHALVHLKFLCFSDTGGSTDKLFATRQEPNESFMAFITKWRAKAAMMTNRPLKKDQIRHDTDRCFRLRHEIQDLIDNKVIAPPQPPKPNVTTNSLPPHGRVPPPPYFNLIHTLSSTFNPSIYITPTHLPKPEVYIPEGTELCMMDVPLTQPKPKNPMVVVPMLEVGKLSEKKYDPG
ncbi:hypothetical protein CsSME_00047265 [Camellia sinensis var. sinensis]